MTTALDLIKSGMRKAGILTKSESPAADEAVDALGTMNAMLSSWALDTLLVSYRTTESFALTPGKTSYTIGSGGEFNTVRPIRIISAFVRSGTTDTPVKITSDDDYAAIQDKSEAGTPKRLNYAASHPLGIITLHPVSNAADTLHLVLEKRMVPYTLTDLVSLPEGWERAIVYNLAIELAPEYGVSTPQETVTIAANSLAAIKSAAARSRPIDVPCECNTQNIFTGFR